MPPTAQLNHLTEILRHLYSQRLLILTICTSFLILPARESSETFVFLSLPDPLWTKSWASDLIFIPVTTLPA